MRPLINVQRNKQRGVILIATLAILASIASLLYSAVSHINIEQQVLASHISQQQSNIAVRQQLQVYFEQLASQQFSIMNHLTLQQKEVIDSPHSNIQLAITKLNESQLYLSNVSENQSVLINMYYDVDNAQWVLVSSTWRQSD